MEQRFLGRSGLRVSRLGLGTMTWGRDTDAHEAADLMKAFLDAGGNLIDTASVYGAAEAVIGDLLGGSISRDDVVLVLRGGQRMRDTGRLRGAAGAPRVDTSRRAMMASLDASLDVLGVDAVDLWLAPGWSPLIPLEETLSALDYAVRSGRARYAGISNYSGWQTARAATLASSSVDGGLIATQVEYSLLERGIEREVLPATAALGLGVLAWAPLARGVLTAKYRHGTPSDSRAATSHLAAFVAPYLDAESRSIVDALATAAEGLGCSPLEVALAWARDRPGITSVLVGARTAAQIRGSLMSEEIELPAEICMALEEISAPALGYPERR